MHEAIRSNVSLTARNTLGVSSTAEHYYALEKSADLPELLAIATDKCWPVTVLGGGSNVVLGERISGLVIQQASLGISEIERDESSVVLAVAAGENWHQLVEHCLEAGLYGLENLALIPGTVGAAPIQNIGAYGVEVGEFITSVQYRNLDSGQQHVFKRDDCKFGYRDSVFKHRLRDKCMIEVVCLRLSLKFRPRTEYPSLQAFMQQQTLDSPSAKQVFEAVVAIRSSRLPDPTHIPNCGSFFKNPQLGHDDLQLLLQNHPDMPYYDDASTGGYKLAAAWLIEQCGFKQCSAGKVQVHPQHALVVVNPEQASGAEIRKFAGQIVSSVEARFGIALEQEPRNYG